jgi:hypothetical protein
MSGTDVPIGVMRQVVAVAWSVLRCLVLTPMLVATLALPIVVCTVGTGLLGLIGLCLSMVRCVVPHRDPCPDVFHRCGQAALRASLSAMVVLAAMWRWRSMLNLATQSLYHAHIRAMDSGVTALIGVPTHDPSWRTIDHVEYDHQHGNDDRLLEMSAHHQQTMHVVTTPLLRLLALDDLRWIHCATTCHQPLSIAAVLAIDHAMWRSYTDSKHTAAWIGTIPDHPMAACRLFAPGLNALTDGSRTNPSIWYTLPLRQYTCADHLTQCDVMFAECRRWMANASFISQERAVAEALRHVGDALPLWTLIAVVPDALLAIWRAQDSATLSSITTMVFMKANDDTQGQLAAHMTTDDYGRLAAAAAEGYPVGPFLCHMMDLAGTPDEAA